MKVSHERHCPLAWGMKVECGCNLAPLLAEIERLEDAIHKHEKAVGSQDDLSAEVVAINRHLWSVIR